MFKDFFNATLLKFVGSVFEVLLQIYLTHKLSTDAFGKYSYIIGTGSLVFYILFGGKVKFIIKNTAIQNNIEAFQKKFRIFYVFPLTVGLLLFGAIILNSDFVNIIVFAFLMHLFMEENAYLFGKSKVTKALVTEYIILKFVTLALIVGLACAFKINLTIALLCTYTAYVISIIIQKIVVSREEKIYSNRKPKSILKEIIVFQIIETLANTYSNIPRMLQYFIGGATETAYFTIATIVRNLLNFISGPTVKVFFNDFAKAFHDGDMKALKDNYRDSTRWQIYIIIPVFLAIMFFPDLVLKVFGANYADAKLNILIISLATFITLIPGPTSNLLQMIGEENFELISQFISFITFILGLVFFLIFNMKELAVPIALLFSSIIVTLVRIIYIIKKFKIMPYNLIELCGVIIFILVESLTIILLKTLKFNPYVIVFLYVILAIFLHYFLSPNKKDRELIKSIFLRKNM